MSTKDETQPAEESNDEDTARSTRPSENRKKNRQQAARTADVLTHSSPRGSSRVEKKWSWHYRVLLTLQRRLLRKRDKLRSAATDPLEPHSLDEADSATDEFDHDMALAQLSAKQDALYEVNAAIKRLLDGKYGICEATGERIPPSRLRAIPWARFTQAVEARLEERGETSSARVRRPATVRRRGEIWLRRQEAADGPDESLTTATPANDETLSEVYSPPGRRLTKEKPGVPARARRKSAPREKQE
jgi:RNA polymerase-binding transcription factor DksA